MPLETGNTIESLRADYPYSGDPHNQGDDHIRLVKHVLGAQFPGVDGNGFKIAIDATEEEINWLTGLSGNVQGQFDAIGVRLDGLEGKLSAPAGTSLTFYQAAPPEGWTIDDTNNDAMMRVVSAGGGVSGNPSGDSPILNDKVPSHTHETASGGEHTHTTTGWRSVDPLWQISYNHGGIAGAESAGAVAQSAGSHIHSVDANAAAANWEPKYINMIVAVKD